MSWEEQFPIEFDDVDVELHMIGGSLEIVVKHGVDGEDPLVMYEESPDMTYEQLIEMEEIDL